jgi:hypothetical protein
LGIRIIYALFGDVKFDYTEKDLTGVAAEYFGLYLRGLLALVQAAMIYTGASQSCERLKTGRCEVSSFLESTIGFPLAGANRSSPA